jgi:hypothetical protein
MNLELHGRRECVAAIIPGLNRRVMIASESGMDVFTLELYVVYASTPGFVYTCIA